jgi:hypothetical protein
MATDTFRTDVSRFFRGVDLKIEAVLGGTAKQLHARVRDITPYRTGRARASWNIKGNASDDQPAPDIGLGGIDATDAEIAAANAFFDSLARSKSNFQIDPGTKEVHVTNTVHYIEGLNAGRSQQAPAGFFNAVVASADLVARSVAAKVATGGKP